jgi:CubicO group peptidase (beta-lactamase class C family)
MVYSNAGYGVAAALAERAAGEPWESLLEKRFFGPLGMRSAGLGWPATVEGPDQPWGHSGSPPVPQPPDAPYRLPACLAPAGGVHASIEDFARYARFHLQELRGRKLFLEPATARLLHTPVGGYAMGWMDREVAGRKATWHNGSAGTFFAWMSLWPELDLAVVVVTSAGDGEPACEEATVALARRFFPGGAEARPPAAPAGK